VSSGIAKQVLHTGGTKFLIFGARFLLVYLLAQVLSPAEFGVFALISTINAFGVFLVGLNLFQYVYRVVPGVEITYGLRVFKSTFYFEVVAAFLAVGILFGTGASDSLFRSLQLEGYERAMLLGFLLLVALIAAGELQHFLWARTRIEAANLMDLLSQASWIVVLAAVWLLGGEFGLQAIIGANLAAVVLAVLAGFLFVGVRRFAAVSFDGAVVRKALVFSIPLIIPSLSFYGLKLADRFILGYYQSLDDVGLYSYAATFFNSIYAFSTAILFGVMVPRVMHAHNEGDGHRRDRLLALASKNSVIIFLLFAGTFLLFARPIVRLIAPPEFLASVPVMPLLALGFLLMTVANPAHCLLLMQDRTRLIMTIDVVGLVTGLSLNLLLVPRYSFYGSAVAIAFGFGLVAILKHVAARSWLFLPRRHLLSLRQEIDLLKAGVNFGRARLLTLRR
jgi:O-antigen/teichoic acid export membrane protein